MSKASATETVKSTGGSKAPWTKENVGYCTFLMLKIPEYSEKISAASGTSVEEKPKIRKKTKRKLHATKEYINQNRRELWTYLYHRELRREDMESRITAEGLSADAAQLIRDNHFEKETQYLRVRRARTSLNEFMILAKLGKGGYGHVYLCKKIDTGEILALKQMKKSRFTDQNEVQRIKKEREVMTKINSPWLARLKYCFQSHDYLYMAMEYIPGGDIKHLLDHVGCLPEDDSRFLFAEMALAVDALHQLGYIHRDLKPDNFMIDRYGHLKLIDFGLSKEGFTAKMAAPKKVKSNSSFRIATWMTSNNALIPQTKVRNRHRKVLSVVGSPEYMAIEILNQEGYSHLVDYWSLGVILFEFCYGMTPFGADTVSGVFENVKQWKTKIVRPPRDENDEEEEISDACWDLITKLITSADTRIGSLDSIKKHPWFEGFDWSQIREMEPPFIPNLENENDTSYFPIDVDLPAPQGQDPMGIKDIEFSVNKDLEKSIKKQMARSTEKNSLEAVYSHMDGKPEKHIRRSSSGADLEKLLKLKLEDDALIDNNAFSSSTHSTSTLTHSSETSSQTSNLEVREHPKLKFNQSCSKFDFAGFTFKHEEMPLFDMDSPREDNARSRSNSTVDISALLDAANLPPGGPAGGGNTGGLAASTVITNPKSPEPDLHGVPLNGRKTPPPPSNALSPGIGEFGAGHSSREFSPPGVIRPMAERIKDPLARASSPKHEPVDLAAPPPAKFGRTNTVQVLRLGEVPPGKSAPMLFHHTESTPLPGSISKSKDSEIDNIKKRVARLKSKGTSTIPDTDEVPIPLTTSSPHSRIHSRTDSSGGSKGSSDADKDDEKKSKKDKDKDKDKDKEKDKDKSSKRKSKGRERSSSRPEAREPQTQPDQQLPIQKDSQMIVILNSKNKPISPRGMDSPTTAHSHAKQNSQDEVNLSANRKRAATSGVSDISPVKADSSSKLAVKTSTNSAPEANILVFPSVKGLRHRSEGKGRRPHRDSGNHSSGTASPKELKFAIREGEESEKKKSKRHSSSKSGSKEKPPKDELAPIDAPVETRDRSKSIDHDMLTAQLHGGPQGGSNNGSGIHSSGSPSADEQPAKSVAMSAKDRILSLAKAYRESQANTQQSLMQQQQSISVTYEKDKDRNERHPSSGLSSGKSSPSRGSSPSRYREEIAHASSSGSIGSMEDATYGLKSKSVEKDSKKKRGSAGRPVSRIIEPEVVFSSSSVPNSSGPLSEDIIGEGYEDAEQHDPTSHGDASSSIGSKKSHSKKKHNILALAVKDAVESIKSGSKDKLDKSPRKSKK